MSNGAPGSYKSPAWLWSAWVMLFLPEDASPVKAELEEEGGRRKEEGGRRKEKGSRNEEGGRRKKEGGKSMEEGSRKEKGGRRKEENHRHGVS